MTTALAILLTAAQAQPGAVPLACSLRTPRSELVAFSAEARSGGLALVPAAGARWASEPLLAVPVGKPSARTSEHRFGDAKTGHQLTLVQAGEHTFAMLFKLDRGKPELPVAVGFCGAGSPPSDAAAPAAALQPSQWGTSDCALTSPDGRAVKIDYSALDRGRAVFTSLEDWPWAGRVEARRGSSGVSKGRVGVTKLGGSKGVGATEYFYVSQPSAAHVLLFDKLAAADGYNGPAAAICGYGTIVRAPNRQ